MRFEWDENKSHQNRRKHGVGFETATLVFDDPYALTKRDLDFDDEERWVTVGAVGPGSLLFVVHLFRDRDDEEIIRIISARAAEFVERKAYEEAHKASEARHRRHRRQERRRH
ncbi:MAG: BrnT family toxin [Candidatus Acidiferrales bacterium]